MNKWLVSLLLATTPVFAYDQASSYGDRSYGSGSDYQPWRGEDQQLEEMLKELEQLIDKAERARAADPTFLRDLRSLSGRYGNVWKKRIVFDDFSDGNFNRDPAWEVASGSFWVEPGRGLRSSVDPNTSQQQSSNDEDEDIAKLLLEALLEKQGGQSSNGSGQQNRSTARIKLPVTITNAFRIRTSVSINKQGGRFSLNLLYSDRGRERHAYRLHYLPGEAVPLVLVRIDGRRRTNVGEYKKALDIGDGRDHQLTWTRDRAGNFQVSIDDNILIKAKDTSFLPNFSGVMLVNNGNDMTMRSIEIEGTE
jgi:hypothetical protein